MRLHTIYTVKTVCVYSYQNVLQIVYFFNNLAYCSKIPVLRYVKGGMQSR